MSKNTEAYNPEKLEPNYPTIPVTIEGHDLNLPNFTSPDRESALVDLSILIKLVKALPHASMEIIKNQLCQQIEMTNTMMELTQLIADEHYFRQTVAMISETPSAY